MTRVRVLGVFLVGLSLLAFPRISSAQDKTARGTVTAIAGESLTVKMNGNDMKFTVDPQTVVVASGAGTRTRRAAQAGEAGPKLSEFVRTGQAVMVTYREAGGAMRATRVQVISTAGSSGSGRISQAAAKTATGNVKSVSGSSLMISAGGKDMTFAIDSSTNVVARGAGTKAAAAGGKIAITDLVSNGDRLSVTYQDTSGTMHASSVRMLNTTAAR